MSFILVICVTIIAFAFGWFFGYAHCIYNVVKTSLQTNTEVSVLSIEVQGQSLYAYDSKGNFVAQGSSIQDLAETCLNVAKIDKAIVIFSNQIAYFIQGRVYKA
jgi:hypothetical protein